MEELAHEGATMIVVTHEMAFAREAADRVYYIDEGVFLEVGPPEQVIDNPQDPRTRDFLARGRGARPRRGRRARPRRQRAPPRGRGSGAPGHSPRGARPPLAIAAAGVSKPRLAPARGHGSGLARCAAPVSARPARPAIIPACPSSPVPMSSTSPTSPASA